MADRAGRARVAPAAADTDLTTLVPVEDAEAVAAGAEAGGNPVTGLVALLRERAGDQAGRWLHRGLTSQDVLDTALMLCLRDALARIRAELVRAGAHPGRARRNAPSPPRCWRAP